MNQKEAVYSCVCSFINNTNKEIGEGSIASQLSKDDQRVIVDMVTRLFIDGQVNLSSPQADIRKYVVGLVNNWLRKDTRLNDGSKYVAKNPGSRSCVSDPVIKNLKALLSDPSLTTAQRAYIQGEIDSRVAATKPQPVAVNMDLLPANIKAILNK